MLKIKTTNNNNNTITSTVLLPLLLVASLSVSVATAQQAAYAQAGGERGIEVLPSVPATVAPDGTFQNTDDGIRLKVPNGWGIKDVDNSDPILMRVENLLGFSTLATVCNEHTTGLGGTTECDVTPGSIEVNIIRIQDLNQRPEVRSLILSQNKTITMQDLMIIYQESVLDRDHQYDDLRPVATTPKQINMTDAAGTATNSTTTEGLLIEWQLTPSGLGPYKLFSLLVLSPDKNTGYAVAIQGQPVSRMPTIPTEVQQIFDSFELIVT
jgi:hypothetical protein